MTVVLIPTMACSECCAAMYSVRGAVYNEPAPASLLVKCINSRCPEHHKVVEVPLQRVGRYAIVGAEA
jgi:hypothetical protein